MNLARKRGPVRVFRFNRRLRVELRGGLAQMLVSASSWDRTSIEKLLVQLLMAHKGIPTLPTVADAQLAVGRAARAAERHPTEAARQRLTYLQSCLAELQLGGNR